MLNVHLHNFHVTAFKRFTDLTVEGLTNSARLIVLAGPNGSGKSSFFDALKVWHWFNGASSSAFDDVYHHKVGLPPIDWGQAVQASMFEDITELSPENRKKLIYIRSAYRNEADFALAGLQQLPSLLDSVRVQRTIDNDVSVSQNYQRLIFETLGSVFDETLAQDETRAQIRDRFIGQVRESLQRIFSDLRLDGVSSNPINGGTFIFTKGGSPGFPYKNLSAGEKAAFDLLLDLAMSGRFYDNTVWCIDEPETHLNARVQAALLDELLRLLPPNCQLILASHSLGFMRRAWEMAQAEPARTIFLDFGGRNFDVAVTMRPAAASRKFWSDTLDVALGDLATLVAPEQVVLCEGRPITSQPRTSDRAEFDAKCYRVIFESEFPTTDFVSIGNSNDVRDDKLELGQSIQAISSGTKVIRVIDRDLLSDDEVSNLKNRTGVMVLGRRHIESYLLDNEVIDALCTQAEKPQAAAGLRQKVQDLVRSSAEHRGNDGDDLKSIAGEWQTEARRTLGMLNSGSTWQAFAVRNLAPLIQPGMNVYEDLRQSIFGSR